MIERIRSYLRTHSVIIAVSVITLAFMAILTLQAIATSQLQTEVQTQQQIVAQTKTILGQLSKNAATRTSQIEQLNKHIDCIALFFAQPDRTSKTISNIETCTVITTNGKTTVIFQPNPTPVAVKSAASTSTPAPTPAPVKQPAAAATPAPSPHPVVVVPVPTPAPVSGLISPVFDATKKLLRLP